MKIRNILFAVPMTMILLATTARAEEPAQNTMDIVREGLRADKKVLVATNLSLTAEETKAFWPIYDRYQKELFDVQSRLFEVISEYAATRDTLTDQGAMDLTNRYLAAEEDRAKVRRSYVKSFSKAVNGRTLARFYQIENKIDAVVRFEAASEIPLVLTK